MTTEPTTLYRAYAQNGELLYVGIADNWPRRMRDHRRHSPWFDDATRLTFEMFPTRAEAMRAERLAIETEKPRHNVMMNAEGRSEWAVEVGPPADETWNFASIDQVATHSGKMRLLYQLEWADCTYVAGVDPIDTYLTRLRACDADLTYIEISWYVEVTGKRAPKWGQFEAPFCDQRSRSFLDEFTWPKSSITGERVNFFALPIATFQPELERRLRWRPGALQTSVNLEDLIRNAK